MGIRTKNTLYSQTSFAKIPNWSDIRKYTIYNKKQCLKSNLTFSLKYLVLLDKLNEKNENYKWG